MSFYHPWRKIRIEMINKKYPFPIVKEDQPRIYLVIF